MYFDKLLLAVRKVHVVYTISNHDNCRVSISHLIVHKPLKYKPEENYFKNIQLRNKQLELGKTILNINNCGICNVLT